MVSVAVGGKEMSRITESARNQECQVRIIGVCNGDAATVVWAHVNTMAAGKGRGLKAPDLLGAYACSSCHDVYDGRVRRPNGMSKDAVDLDFADGHYRSIVMLIEKRLLNGD